MSRRQVEVERAWARECAELRRELAVERQGRCVAEDRQQMLIDLVADMYASLPFEAPPGLPRCTKARYRSAVKRIFGK